MTMASHIWHFRVEKSLLELEPPLSSASFLLLTFIFVLALSDKKALAFATSWMALSARTARCCGVPRGGGSVRGPGRQQMKRPLN